MNSKRTQNYVLSIVFAFLLAFAFVPKVNADFLKSTDIFFEREITGNITFADCEATRKMANEIVDKLIARDFEGVRKNFNEYMTKNLSAEQLKAVWTSVTTEIGEYKSREKSLYQEYPDNVAVFTRLQMEKGRVVVEVRFGADGKIAGLWLRPV